MGINQKTVFTKYRVADKAPFKKYKADFMLQQTTLDLT